MSEQLDRYFALEASEYLDELQALLSSGGARPDLDQLLRLCGGVRGSAQMAGAETVKAVAERLEDGLRSVQAGQVHWSDEIGELSLQTVRDLDLLVRASARWTELGDERVQTAIARWSELDPHAPVAIEALFYDDGGPHVLTPDHEVEMNHPTAAALPEPIPIESLLLERDDALREALAMRDPIERAIREVPGAEVELGATLRELFELLEIAVAEGAARG